MQGGSFPISSCRHGNHPRCDLDQWPKSVTRSRPRCSGTKFGRACTKSSRSWSRATLQLIWQRFGWRHAAGSSQVANRRLFDATGWHVRIVGNDKSFAAILGDGSVVTWGTAWCGGDSSSAQDQLNNVQQIQASECAFAAILADGSVVT